MSRALRLAATDFHHVQAPPFDIQLMFTSPSCGRSQLREIGRSVSATLKGLDVDWVICQGTSMLPFLETDASVCVWHDSTWHTLLQIPFDEFCQAYPLLYEWDQMVLQKADVIAYAADWVCEATLRNYSVEPAKISVIPFGASLFEMSEEAVQHSINSRPDHPCQLTFVGVDWLRKGLPLAYALLNRLKLLGHESVLNVIGYPAAEFEKCHEYSKAWLGTTSPFSSAGLFNLRLISDESVRVLGFLDKKIDSDYEKFTQILRATHFLVHPASFECFGVALTEANALGVPVLALRQYGPTSIVRPGINGQLFDADTFVENAAAWIVSRLTSYADYREDCRRSRAEYNARLNWQTSCRALLDLLLKN